MQLNIYSSSTEQTTPQTDSHKVLRFWLEINRAFYEQEFGNIVRSKTDSQVFEKYVIWQIYTGLQNLFGS